MSKNAPPRRLLDSALSRIGVGIAVSAVVLTAVFSILVFENQLGLIGENALLRSVQVGLQLQRRVEAAASSGWTRGMEVVQEEARALDLKRLRVFSSTGDLLYAFEPPRVQGASGAQGKGAARGAADGQGGQASQRTPAPQPGQASLPAPGSPGSPGSQPGQATQAAQTSQGSLPALGAQDASRRDFQNQLFTHSLDIPKRTIDLYIPFSATGSEDGVISVELGIGYIDTAIRNLRRQALALAAVVIALHGLLALGAYLLLVRPLYRLVQATQAVAGGQYNLTLPRSSTYEMATLVDSFLTMSRSVGQAQQTARASNPLTGLPGNVEIERHILERLQSGLPFAVLYCDLDNFKAYNDCYGFSRGDDVILYTRDCLGKAAAIAPAGCFVGHQGGDDFVAVCSHDDWERVASSFVALFDHGIQRFYNEADRARGFILSKDRQDREKTFPMMSVSVAAVSSQNRRFDSFGEIVAKVSEVKRMVKGKSGSGYAIDRRGE